jgi:hypothetical protein
MRALILGLFLILFFGSLYFSLERILYSDSSFILFRIINLESLQPQEHRYGSFITQGFPLIASKLHLPLSWIILLYSASFNLFYLAVAMVLVLKLKEYALSILMSFYFVLFVSDSYYWITNEVHQGIAWMFLLFGLTIYFFKKKISFLISLSVFSILAFLSIYTHPLVMFPASFLWIFLLLQEKNYKKRSALIFSLVLLSLCISKFFLSSKSGHYDSDKLHMLTHSSLKDIWHSFSSPFVKEFFKRCMSNYWFIPILFSWGIYSATKSKKYNEIVLVLAFVFVYMISMSVTFSDFLPFYTESELMPATIILTSLFVYFTIPSLKRQTIIIILATIFISRLFYIGLASEKFTERKKWLFAQLKNMREKNIQKGIINRKEVKWVSSLSYWATPQESILASALSNDQPRLTFIVSDSADISKRLPANNRQMLDAFELWDIGSVNKNYFAFDTIGNYQPIAPVDIKK